jgi:hypothetical protein
VVRPRPAWLLALALAACASLAGRCGGGSGRGAAAVDRLESRDERCAVLGSQFPPGFDFLPGPGARAVVADFAPPKLLGFDIDGETPVLGRPTPVLEIPPDSDGDGREEGSRDLPLGVVLDGVVAGDPGLAEAGLVLATASGYDEVVFAAPDLSALRALRVSVPASFAAGDNPFLPAPGASALRTGLSTLACVRPDPDALDSRGERIRDVLSLALSCDAETFSYLATFTSGAAVAAGRLFVSTSNLGDDAGTTNPQFLPGSVLVYDLDLDADPPAIAPNEETPVVLTSGFNPTQVTPYRVGDRELVLVTVSGAIGIEQDDPFTDPIEAGGVALTDAAIDVIDAETLELVATVPLGPAGLAFDRLAIDPTGRVAVAGSAVGRDLYAVDLSPLADPLLGSGGTAVLDGSGGPDAVIFDAEEPLAVPAFAGGAPEASCPGFTVGVAFDHRGDRLFATEFCDGTLTRFAVDLRGDPEVPVPAERFSLLSSEALVFPIRPETLGRPRALASLAIRPGVPGVDFDGPDLFFLVGQPEGLFCAARLESP